MSTLAKRLKEARLRVGLSQEQLGIDAGLDPASASARMNRYELGKRIPDLATVERLGEVLGVPAAYFYATAEDEAELLRQYHSLSAQDKSRVQTFMASLLPLLPG